MDSKKELLLALLQQDPFIGQQALAERLGLSRSAVAGHIAALTREGRILGRAYVLPQQAPSKYSTGAILPSDGRIVLFLSRAIRPS